MPTIKPQSVFADQMAKAARASTQAGKTITTTEADKALTSLASLAPKAKVAAVEAFLASTGANKLSPAARDTLRDFVARNDTSPTIPDRPAPYTKFLDAVAHAAQGGKVKGQITKGEIEKAFKHISSLPMASQKALAQEVLAGPYADNLSKAARAIVDARASVQISIWGPGPSTEAVGEEGGGHMVTLAIPEGGATTAAIGEEGGGASTEAVGEEGGETTTKAMGEEGTATTMAMGEEGGGGNVTSMALGEEGGGSTEAVGEEGGGQVTSMALGEEGGGSTEAVGEEGGGMVTMAIPEGGATTMAMGEEGGFTTEAIGEE